MTLKDIKQHFHVIGENGVYNLYDPNLNSSKYMNYRYLCTIHYNYRVGQVKVLNPRHDEMPDMEYLCFFDKKVNVDHLVKTVYDVANSLPYPSEFYDPSYVEDYKTMMKVDYYLKSIGFEYNSRGYNWNSYHYVLNKIHPFAKRAYINLELEFDKDARTGIIKEHLGSYSWTEAKFDGVDDAIAKINSIIEPVLLSTATFALKVEDNMSNVRDNLSNVELKAIDVSDLTNIKSYTENMKEKTIKALEDALKQLKNS